MQKPEYLEYGPENRKLYYEKEKFLACALDDLFSKVNVL